MIDLINKDFRDGMAGIPDESVDLVFTDPPYARQYSYIWSPLAEESKRILKSGGSLISLCGIVNLPYIINTVSEHLDYFWCCALLHKEVAEVRSTRIYNTWKPVIWFSRGEPTRKPIPIPDGISPFRAQKDDHRWQQPENWAEHFVDYVVPNNGVVVDPFMGSGTVGVVCKNLDIHFIGIDSDPAAFETAKRRIWTSG